MVSTVSYFCDISCKLDIEYDDLEDFNTETGETFKRLGYDLQMVPSGAALEFVIYVNGRKQLGQNTNVRFQ